MSGPTPIGDDVLLRLDGVGTGYGHIDSFAVSSGQ